MKERECEVCGRPDDFGVLWAEMTKVLDDRDVCLDCLNKTRVGAVPETRELKTGERLLNPKKP